MQTRVESFRKSNKSSTEMQRQELDQEMIYAKYYLQLKNQLYGQLYEEIPQIPQIDEKEDESGKRSNTCIVS